MSNVNKVDGASTKNRQRIIAVTHEFYPFPGGIAVYVREIATALAGDGYAVEVWCPPHPELNRRQWPFAVVPCAGKNQSWLERRKTARLWRRKAADVRDATLWLAEPGAILTAFYNRFFRLPAPRRLALTLHGSEILNFTRMPHRQFLFNRLLERADTASVLSEHNAELLRRRTKIAPEKIRLAPGAVRSDFAAALAAGSVAGNVAGSVVSGAAGTITVLAVGRIHPRKGQRALLEAAALLPPAVHDRLRIELVGRVVDRDEHARLKKLAAEHHLRVEFRGEVPDAALPAIYAGADIFALTSLPQPKSIEGFGLVALEAGAAGLPTLAHDTGGIRDAVLDGVTGILAPADNRPALADALHRLITDTALRRHLGTNARTRANQFSWSNSAGAALGLRL